MTLPGGYVWDLELQQGRETFALTQKLWPPFIWDQSDLPDFDLQFEITPAEFKRNFPVWGIREQTSGRLVAFANAALVSVDLSRPELPAKGWDFAVRSAFSASVKNCLCLLVANIDPEARGLGLATSLIERAKQHSRELGFSELIAPVRPTLKHLHQDLSLAQYLALDQQDPWLELHLRLGAQMANVCPESVTIKASPQKWREWTALPLADSGSHKIPLGLAPLQLDLKNQMGLYLEPNVWCRYPL